MRSASINARWPWLFGALVFFFISGCILSPEEDPAPPPDQEEVYKDLTDKENLIFNLQQCYKYTNIDRYQEILHPDYIWYNQETDVLSGKTEEFYTRDVDIERTNRIFLAKNNRHPDPNKVIDKLELSIESAAWQRVDEIGGNPCEDCWETTRNYLITIVTDGGNKTIIGDDLVKFTVVPFQRNGQKIYLIYRADDIKI